MLKKLRIKFVCIIMAIVFVLLFAVFMIVVHAIVNDMYNESFAEMQWALDRVEFQLSHHEDRPEEEYWEDFFWWPQCFVIELNSKGDIVERYWYYGTEEDEENLVAMVKAAIQHPDLMDVLQDYNVCYLCRPIQGGTRIAFLDHTHEQKMVTLFVHISIFVLFAGLVTFFLLSLFFAYWIIRPVEFAWQQQKQFIADASHELKTPLTVMMTNAELLRAPTCTQEERMQFSQNILTMTQQMRGLVGSMLDLARLDALGAHPAFTPVPFSEMITDAVLPFEPIFFEKGLTLRTEMEPDITVNGLPNYLQQLVDILLDNAQKYTSPGGEAVVELQKANHHCRLCVASQGEPLTPKQCKEIFKRFYRVDKARPMSQGYGLGLSIANSIAQEHGGRIWAESDNGYNRFFVELPLAKTSRQK